MALFNNCTNPCSGNEFLTIKHTHVLARTHMHSRKKKKGGGGGLGNAWRRRRPQQSAVRRRRRGGAGCRMTHSCQGALIHSFAHAYTHIYTYIQRYRRAYACTISDARARREKGGRRAPAGWLCCEGRRRRRRGEGEKGRGGGASNQSASGPLILHWRAGGTTAPGHSGSATRSTDSRESGRRDRGAAAG